MMFHKSTDKKLRELYELQNDVEERSYLLAIFESAIKIYEKTKNKEILKLAQILGRESEAMGKRIEANPNSVLQG